jgi:hypothetical protein
LEAASTTAAAAEEAAAFKVDDTKPEKEAAAAAVGEQEDVKEPEASLSQFNHSNDKKSFNKRCDYFEDCII